MSFLPKSVQDLIDEFSRLPGVGPKTAQRLTFFLLRSPASASQLLGKAILDLKAGIQLCEKCQNLTTENPCKICSNNFRDQTIICVVEDPLDLLAIEKSHEFKGVYHVLHGVISPLDGIKPSDLKINQLVFRVKNSDPKIREVILATNPDMEGETTALYLSRLLKPLKVRVTRIARGIPSGGEVEYADQSTLAQALKGRKEF